MRTVSHYAYLTRARIVDRSLPSYGQTVRIVRKINRYAYLIEFNSGGRSYCMNVDSLEII